MLLKLKTIFKNTLREMWQSKARFISILLIVMLGVAIFVGVSSAGPIMKHTADQYFKATKLADLKAQSTIGLTQEDLDRLDGEFDAEVMAEYMEDAFITESNILTRVKSIPADSQPPINQYVVAEGRLPEKEGEIALDAYGTVSEHHQIGDTISFNKGNQEDELNFLKDQKYEIVGFVNSPLYIENGQRGVTSVGNGNLDGFAVVTEESFDSNIYQTAYLRFPASDHYKAYDDEYEQALEDKTEEVDQVLSEQVEERAEEKRQQAQADIDQGWQDLKNTEEDLQRSRQQLEQAGLLDLPVERLAGPIRQQVQAYQEGQKEFEEKRPQAEADLKQAEEDLEQLADADVISSNRLDDAAYVGYGQNAQRIEAIARIFPVFFFVVAILVTLTTMTRMVDEGRNEIGILKSFGYSNPAVSFKYLFYAFLAGFIGWLIGLGGVYIFPTIIYNAYSSLYSMPDAVLEFYWSYSLIALLGAMIATVGATLFTLGSTLRTSPAQLMQPKAPKKGKRILLERIEPLWEALSFNYKITFRNLFRYKKRMFMTILGIAGCTALMLMGFGISDSVNDLLHEQYGTIDKYDGIVAINDEVDPDQVDQLQQKIQDDPLIEGHLFMNAEDTTVSVEGEADQDLSLMVPQDPDEIESYKHLESTLTGETVSIPEEGAMVTEKLAEMKDLKVGDELVVQNEEGEDYHFQIVDIVRNYMGHSLFMNKQYYQSVTGKDWTPDLAWLHFDANDDTEEKIGDELMTSEAVNAIFFVSTLSAQFEDTLGSLDVVVTLLIVAAALLAFVVLYNLTNVNIGERQRELATIKVLGFYDKEVSLYILRENIFLTIFGILAGFVLGVFLHRYIILIVEFSDVMLGRSIHLSSYVYAALLTTLFSLIVMLVMHVKLKNTDMVEALGEE